MPRWSQDMNDYLQPQYHDKYPSAYLCPYKCVQAQYHDGYLSGHLCRCKCLQAQYHDGYLSTYICRYKYVQAQYHDSYLGAYKCWAHHKKCKDGEFVLTSSSIMFGVNQPTWRRNIKYCPWYRGRTRLIKARKTSGWGNCWSSSSNYWSKRRMNSRSKQRRAGRSTPLLWYFPTLCCILACFRHFFCLRMFWCVPWHFFALVVVSDTVPRVVIILHWLRF